MPSRSATQTSKNTTLPLAALTAWMVVAAFSQLCFLAYWPMYVFGQPIGIVQTLIVALLRLGVYTGLAWGLMRRHSTAWSATTLELGRSFLFFAIPVLFGERILTASAYPPAWAQGLLSAGIPLILPFDTALAMGWRPSPHLEIVLTAALRIWGGMALIGALWLRHHGALFSPAPAKGFRGHLPGAGVVLLICLVEGAMLFWTLAGAKPHP